MRKILFVFVVFFSLTPMIVHAEEYTVEEVETYWIEQFDFTEVENVLESIVPEEKLGFKDTLIRVISGELEPTWEMVCEFISDQFFFEIQASKDSAAQVLILVIVAAIFANFSSAFKSTQVSEISFSMLYMLLITFVLTQFRLLITYAIENLDALKAFMNVLGPLYFLAVSIASGSVTSASFYQLFLLLVYFIEVLILHFLVPVTQIYLVVRILGEMSKELPLSRFAELIETIVSWTLRTLLAAVVGFNAIQGILAPAIDSVKRSVITRSGEALPMVGDLIGGTAEIVLGTAVLIKNGIGIVGMICCVLLSAVPVLKLAVTALLYQVLSALAQPVSDKRIVNCISSAADASKMLLRIVFTTSVLFLLTVAVSAATSGG